MSERPFDETFESWMRGVDRHIANRVGLSSSDLPDQPYMDWYTDEMEPEEAAVAALEDAGWEG